MIGPTEGDGDLRPGAIAGFGDDVFYVDGEHPASGELLILSVLGGGEAPEDGGDHFVMILEGIVVAPRCWWPLAPSLLLSSGFLAWYFLAKPRQSFILCLLF